MSKIKADHSISDVLAKIESYSKTCDSPYLNCREAARLIGKSHTWLWTRMCDGDIVSEMLPNKAKKKEYKVVKIDTLKEFVENYVEKYKKPLNPVYPK